MERPKLGRRDFVKSAVGAGVTLGVLGRATPASAAASSRVLGANDRINVALIGCGGRGKSLLRTVMETGGQIEPTPASPFGPSPRDPKPPDPALATQVVAVCDVYARRKTVAA